MGKYSKEVTDALKARRDAEAVLKRSGFTLKDGKPRRLVKLKKEERDRIESLLMSERRCIVTHNGRRATVFGFSGYHSRVQHVVKNSVKGGTSDLKAGPGVVSLPVVPLPITGRPSGGPL